MMTDFYLVEPEVAGGLGPSTVMDRGEHPPRVTRLEYVIEGWLGDALLESFPCIVATRALASMLREVGATGYTDRPVTISESAEFRERHPYSQLPAFVWLDVYGTPGRDDLGADDTGQLVVSRRTLDVLVAAGIAHADVVPWQAG